MDPNVRMYKAINGQVAELVPNKAPEPGADAWRIRRWLKRQERMKFAAHPNCVRANEGRVGEGG